MQHNPFNNIIHYFNAKVSPIAVGGTFVVCGDLYISNIFTRCVFFNNMGKYILTSLIISIMLKPYKKCRC